MKKVFLFLLTATTLVSCGSDDGDGGSKRASMVNIQGGSESLAYTMTYDSKGRLGTLTSTSGGAHTYSFSYNDSGRVSMVTATGSVTEPTSFTYNEEGKIATVTRGNQAPMVVTWTDATTMTVDGTTIKVDNKGDLMMYDAVVFSRDSGKGAFASVKGVDGLSLLFLETQTMFFASKQPVKSISGNGIAYVMNNSLSGGYVSSATFEASGTPYTMNISY